jgi:hypothetical protein
VCRGIPVATHDERLPQKYAQCVQIDIGVAAGHREVLGIGLARSAK